MISGGAHDIWPRSHKHNALCLDTPLSVTVP